MLETFIVLEDVIKTTMALTNIGEVNKLTIDEWAILKELCQVLKHFEKVAKTISGEEYLTASLVIPLANELLSVYRSFLNNFSRLCKKSCYNIEQVI